MQASMQAEQHNGHSVHENIKGIAAKLYKAMGASLYLIPQAVTLRLVLADLATCETLNVIPLLSELL